MLNTLRKCKALGAKTQEFTAMKLTWMILGWAFAVFFEVVSRPQREENLLLRLLQERDIACVRLLTPISVRAAT